MGLFQNSVIQKYIKQIDATLLESKYQECIAHFGKAEIQDNIRSSKEEQYQEGFLRDLFVNILGYTLNPSTGYNLITENKNLKDSKKADGAIIIDQSVKAVIELKGTDTTDLAKVETQAFGYKNNQVGCLYVITSNFEKIRFYIEDATDFEEFSLFNLSREQFALLYLCLSYQSIARGLPLAIKHESTSEEKQITDKFYKAYTSFKRELYHDLVSRNPQFDPLTLFKKSQKLLDRFLFLFFAEDRALLPPNSVRLILGDWRELQERDVQIPLYDRYKKYFGYLNTGYRGKRYDVFAYNGGLFKPDHVLDTVTIDDEMLYRHTLLLSDYDFVSEVDVNILGHIFENSLNEIDEIKAELEGTAVDRSKTKRKKDGVFYTPKYITKYIVHNTVGALCTAKKNELGIIDQDFAADKKRQTRTKQALLDKLALYRTWLLQITICDPACGSGAFLNQALDFLIAEHRYIDELQAKVYGASLILSDVENNILENNIYGVDLNEESVEIAKLSLWLRTAQPGRKLSDLNSNIKCGNSLISDPTIASDKAFNWQDEFPQVFVNGGFDVIIGNPPYVNLEKLKAESVKLEKIGYKTYNKKGDLYVLFVELGFKLLKVSGIISYIMPNKWLQAGYGENTRAFLLSKQIIHLIDFGDIQIFEGATTYPCIFIALNDAPSSTFNVSVLKSTSSFDFNSLVADTQETFDTSAFDRGTWIISSKREKQLLERLNSNYSSLKQYVNGEANYGIKFGLTEAFLIDNHKRDELIAQDPNSAKLIGSILRGRDLKRYAKPTEDDLGNIVLAGYGMYNDIIDNYPAIYQHLLPFAEKLKQRGQCSGSKPTTVKPFNGQHHWLELDNNPSPEYLALYKKPKIMYQAFQVKPCFIYDEQGLFCNNSMWIIPTQDKALLGVLNSKMGWWLISKYCTQIQNGCQLIWKYFGQIPIPQLGNSNLKQLVETMIFNNESHQAIKTKFIDLINSKFELNKVSRKLQNWDELESKDFLHELKICNIKLSLAEESEWIQFFKEQKEKAQKIATLITATDIEIDNLVYQLYGLSPEETKIIENSVK